MVYIIGISGSEMNNVRTYRISGTEDAVKHHIMNEVNNLRYEDEGCYDYGTESIDEIETRGNVLYAYIVFSDAHYDITATPDSEPLILN
jgi:hypothetical protein